MQIIRSKGLLPTIQWNFQQRAPESFADIRNKSDASLYCGAIETLSLIHS
jgi:hypothetical protein